MLQVVATKVFNDAALEILVHSGELSLTNFKLCPIGVARIQDWRVPTGSWKLEVPKLSRRGTGSLSNFFQNERPLVGECVAHDPLPNDGSEAALLLASLLPLMKEVPKYKIVSHITGISHSRV